MLFTFPSRYWFTIGLTGVFSLTGWSRRIRAEFLVFRVTQDTAMLQLASHTGLSPSAVLLSRRFCSLHAYNVAVLLPRSCVATVTVWALPSSLATTKDIDLFFLFLQVLRCFSSLRLPLIFSGVQASPARVAPFGYSRIISCLQIPVTFRSLPRPSSPPEA